MGGIAAGGLLSLARVAGVSASHKVRHCAKDGKRCRKHKECCGLCADGYCRSCDGIVAWADRALTRLADAEDSKGSALAAIRELPIDEEFDPVLLAPIEDASAGITRFSTELSTEVTPPPAADILRTLLEVFAAMADELDRYLAQVSQEAYVKTAAHRDAAATAITNIASRIPPLEAETAVLRDACDD